MRSISHQDISSAIDRYFDAERKRIDAERERIEAKRDFAKGLLAWLEHHQAEAVEARLAPSSDGLMTLQEAAEFLNVTDQTVHAWRKCGIIEGLQYGEDWRFERDKLLKPRRKTQASKKPLRMVS